MRKDELRGMTRQELLELARSHEIRGRNSMKKDELIDALAAQRESPPASAGGETPRPRRRGSDAESGPARTGSAPKRTGRRAGASRAGGPEQSEAPRGGIPGADAPRAETREKAEATDSERRREAGAANREGRDKGGKRRDARQKDSSGRESDPGKARTSAHEPDADDDDGGKWNSLALGRDPNYGRFLNPGSAPARGSTGRTRRPIPQGSPGQPTESLAERSERGRMRAVERSQGARELIRRSGDVRRISPYTNRYGRSGETPPGPRGERDRTDRFRGDRDRSHGGRHERTRAPHEPGGRRAGGAGDRRFVDRDRRAPAQERHEAQRGAGESGRSQRRPRREDFAPRGERARGEKPALPPEDAPVLDAPRVHGEFEGATPETEQEFETRGGWEELSVPVTLSPPPPPTVELPAQYGLDRCRLMVRDPHTIYAYWELQAETLEYVRGQLAAEWDSCRRILRVHGIPVSGNPDEPGADFFDVDHAAEATDHYLTVPHANRAYRVDVGLLTEAGLFYPLASSNTVITPREAASQNQSETWAAPPAKEESGTTEPATDAPVAPAEPPVSPEEQAPGDLTAAEERPGLAPGGPGIPPTAPTSRLGAGAAAAAGPAPSSAGAREGAPASPGAARERGFRFHLQTELVVYGATEPDARVTVQGTPVDLRPDGTFTVRFALPDGVQELPAVAVSADGLSRRSITPTISRSTVSEEAESE